MLYKLRIAHELTGVLDNMPMLAIASHAGVRFNLPPREVFVDRLSAFQSGVYRIAFARPPGVEQTYVCDKDIPAFVPASAEPSLNKLETKDLEVSQIDVYAEYSLSSPDGTKRSRTYYFAHDTESNVLYWTVRHGEQE